VCELTVRAALDGSREHVHHAALLDPSTSGTLSPDQIHAIVEELLDAHGESLPEGLRGVTHSSRT
jgi:alpha-galactosidase